MDGQFGRYELLRRIGVGGMAEVFRARTFGAEGFVKDVVIKRILPGFSEDPEFVTMFINEARLAARLQHANIVQIFDFNQIDGVYYIAMEWVDGTDLRRVISKARARAMPIPVRAVVHVGVETLKGLHYAGTRSDAARPLNIVHRDISPHNLLVSLSGEVKIADFGIAKVAALASATHKGMLKGKLGYMSPEQASGDALDARSDLFAIGIVLWEMLTGRRLYQADSEAELFAQVQRAEVPSPRSLRGDMPRELDAAIVRMLAADRDARHATAAEALEELSAFAGGGDALAMSAYLRELLPELFRESRGETEAMAVEPQPPVSIAEPDASTRTRAAEEQDAADSDVGGSGPQESFEGSDGRASGITSTSTPAPEPPEGSPELPQVESRGPGPRPRLALVVGMVGLCGVVGWVAAGALSARSTARSRVGELRLETVPTGAMVLVDGVEIGVAPRTVRGPQGTILRVEARLGRRRTSARHKLVGSHTLKLELPSAGSSNAAGSGVGPAVAARPDAGPLEVDKTRAARPGAGPLEADKTRAARPGAGPLEADKTRARRARAARSRATRRDQRRRTPRRDVASHPARGWGKIHISVVPWAEVKIDGKDMGTTPIHVRLAAGAHRIELVNTELARRVSVRVKIRAGQTLRLRRSWR